MIGEVRVKFFDPAFVERRTRVDDPIAARFRNALQRMEEPAQYTGTYQYLMRGQKPPKHSEVKEMLSMDLELGRGPVTGLKHYLVEYRDYFLANARRYLAFIGLPNDSTNAQALLQQTEIEFRRLYSRQWLTPQVFSEVIDLLLYENALRFVPVTETEDVYSDPHAERRDIARESQIKSSQMKGIRARSNGQPDLDASLKRVARQYLGTRQASRVIAYTRANNLGIEHTLALIQGVSSNDDTQREFGVTYRAFQEQGK